MKTTLLAVAICSAVLLYAQQQGEISWAPKGEPAKYTAPHKPHTKLADLKSKYAGKKEWSYRVVDDDYFTVDYVYSPAGWKTPQRFHPDTRTWWIVIDGEIRYTIEGEQPFVAKKRGMVQVPAQTLYAMETVGETPSLRLEVNIAKAKTMYSKDVDPPKLPGYEWVKARLARKPFGYDKGNKPHVTFEEFATMAEKKRGTLRFVHDDRGVANFIYGYEKQLPAFDPKNRGHFHPECAEFWLIMSGQIRYPIEKVGEVIASEGDLVYVPKFTYHAPRWHGEGPSTRLAMNGYPNIAHLFDGAAEGSR